MKGDKVFIVIPAYNEGLVIQDVLRELIETVVQNHSGYELVVVDDGSSDGTYDLVYTLPVHLLRHAVNLGQGAALATGIQYALRHNAAIIVTFDSDGQHMPEDIARLVAPVASGQADVALGSRFLEDTSKVPWRRRILLKAVIYLTVLLNKIRLTDAHNGLRAFSAAAARQIRITQNRMAHASEIISEIARLKLRYVEVPVQVRYTAYSRQKGQRAIDGLNILIELLEGRLP
jgi:polyprenyl-phospho-N-acetylgalactosaminyl synthase